MKKLSILIFSMFVCIIAFSQTSSDLRPIWTKSIPNTPSGANYFLNWGVGEGNNEQQAINDAWADALQKSLHELGVVGITQQDIDAVAKNGIDAVVSFNKMKRRQLCVTNAIRKSTGKVMVYILIQVQRNVNGKDDFYDVNPNICSDFDFDRKLKEIDDGIYSFSARVFVPGMAQLHKGNTTKGVLFIVGEVAMIGGVVAFEGLRSSYDSKINTTHNATDKQSYIDKVNNMQNLRNGFIAGAAALYVWNVIDGIVGKGKKHVMIGNANVQLLPYAAPDASGIMLAIKF
ncbi:MAG: hypothetical protein LBL90_13480 [Prevotellaceae bacterium]|jgi:hypothetical protein|nr:hypothetical protein [Prevotellaceae bacterium]